MIQQQVADNRWVTSVKLDAPTSYLFKTIKVFSQRVGCLGKDTILIWLLSGKCQFKDEKCISQRRRTISLDMKERSTS